MISSVSIDNFKGMRRFRIEDMGRVCLISGKNNVGKSTLLEALFLLMDHTSNNCFANLNGFRGAAVTMTPGSWEPLFHNLDVSVPMRIAVVDDGNSIRLSYEKDSSYLPLGDTGVPDDVLAQFRTATKETYALKFDMKTDGYSETGHFFASGNGLLRQLGTSLPGNEVRPMRRTRYLSAALSRSLDVLADVIGKLELMGEKHVVIDVLKELDPSIEDIITISHQGFTQLHVRSAGRWLPLQFAGDGVIRLLQICLAILEWKDSLLLIDELDAGLHYSMFESLWKVLDRMSKVANCQVIATTHSYEMICSVRGNIENADDFSYYRIGRSKEETKAYRYSYSMLDAALASELEVR